MRRFNNPLAFEMMRYLELLDKAMKYTRGIESTFEDIEKYIPLDAPKEQALSLEILFKWDFNLTCAPKTRKRKYIELRGFMRFLQTLGIHYSMPQIPRTDASDYVPYIFDQNEWNRIILEVDILSSELKHTGSDMPIVFPMLIRLLYACGLRVSESLAIKIKDIDFEAGCLSVHKSKRNRHRIVPMKESTTILLKRYCTRRVMLFSPETFIFACNGANPPSQSWIQRWFSILLEKSDISQTRSKEGERGICPHCIRHTFTYRSFHSSADTFENTVPFLSTYLGHENIRETDRYLRFSYELYKEAHEMISEYTNGIFPEVDA